VRNLYSLVSAGTEGSTVKAARSSLIEKAKQRPQQVKQVLEVLKSQGPVQTYRAVMKKLDAYSPLGYSCVGRVQGFGFRVQGFKEGDWVACGGLTANHAEMVSVPENLCVKLRPDADLKKAAYNTLGAIAMQGVRQADLRLGESCAVIGMGLLGQLTCLLLRAAGVRVAGVDIDKRMVAIAGRHCADLALTRDAEGIQDRVIDFTGGLGCDAVIITAATDSLDPINFAGMVARKKGTVVLVGAVPTGFDREPHYYKKELQVRMSCSYGPGRYDPIYEEKGIDYPAAYVRWTEKRNMEAFQELIYTKKIDVGYLTTHVFKLEDAPKAYDMMLAKSEPFIGILIEYDAKRPIQNEKIIIGRAQGAGFTAQGGKENEDEAVGLKNDLTADGRRQAQTKSELATDPHGPTQTFPGLKLNTSNLKPGAIGIGFIGAGSYAQSHLLPNLPIGEGVALVGVMTATGTGARSVGERFGFEFCTGDEKDILENPEINTVFIATRHDSHAGYVLKALRAGKHVFVEKPLCLKEDELQEIISAADPRRPKQTKDVLATDAHEPTQKCEENQRVGKTSESLTKHLNTSTPKHQILMVGYNRRFSPFAQMIKETLGDGPMAMTYRVNAGAIPKDSWIQDPDFGGGRVIGEVCHFVDFLTYLNGSLPVSVHAHVLNDPHHLNDTITVSLSYVNGSIGTISYFANGDKSLPKERVEFFAHGCTAVLEDFKRLTIRGKGKSKEKKLLSQDKGQKNEVRVFLDAVREGKAPPIPYAELFSTSLATFKILESIQTGQSQKLY
jgi:polar amino acid transport system substrate-binding protein